jgi:hypothetical protein
MARSLLDRLLERAAGSEDAFDAVVTYPRT